MKPDISAIITELLEQRLNEEETPADIAKKHGLVYGGFAQWIDPKTRVTKAITKDGKFQWKRGNSESRRQNLGRLSIFNIDGDVIHGSVSDAIVGKPDTKSTFAHKYELVVKKALQAGNDFLLLTPRNGEEAAAKYLVSIGISSGVKLKPIGSGEPQKIHEFVKRKVKQGYQHILYFDSDPKNIASIESLRATFNRLSVKIETYQLPKLERSHERST